MRLGEAGGGREDDWGERKGIREEGKTKREGMRVILKSNESIFFVIYLEINTKKNIILVFSLSSFCYFYIAVIEEK